MIGFKQYIAKQLIGHKLRFHCDCAFGIDSTGTIVDSEIVKNEIIFLVDVNGRIIKIGENHPGMEVERA